MLVIAMTLTLSACDGGNAFIETETTPEPPPISETTPTPDPTPEPPPESTPEPVEPVCEHTWQEANFQQPRMCLECGETDGERVTARFAEYGLTLSPQGSPVPYITTTHNRDAEIEGLAIFNSFSTVDYINVNIGGGFRSLGEPIQHENWRTDPDFDADDFFGEGSNRIGNIDWEWQVIHFQVNFTCDMSYNEGWLVTHGIIDYYSIDLSLSADEGLGAGMSGAMRTFRLNYNGNEYETYVFHTFEVDYVWRENVTQVATFVYHVFVPVGFDGVVITFINPANFTDGGATVSDVFDENTLFFRARNPGIVLNW